MLESSYEGRGNGWSYKNNMSFNAVWALQEKRLTTKNGINAKSLKEHQCKITVKDAKLLAGYYWKSCEWHHMGARKKKVKFFDYEELKNLLDSKTEESVRICIKNEEEEKNIESELRKKGLLFKKYECTSDWEARTGLNFDRWNEEQCKKEEERMKNRPVPVLIDK